tara:strand:- start:1170 stop:1460 length:291 start_codon:yes stop_codon:yes gene_type:complete
LAIVKSKIIKQLSDNYPNFVKKDLIKLIDIILNDMKNSLSKSERVELRDIFTLETKIQKARLSRNPKTNENITTPEKKYIRFKMSKEWMKKINENS